MSSRRTSDIWYHFNLKDTNKAECKYCKSILSITGGSQGNLRRHLKSKHPTVPLLRISTSSEESRDRSPSPSIPSTSASTSSQPEASIVGEPCTRQQEIRRIPSRDQANLTNFIDVIKPLSLHKKHLIDQQLLKMICKDYHPFSLVESEQFKKFVALLCPNYIPPSRKTLSQSLLPQMYDNLVITIKSKLVKTAAVALTTDGWTSVNNQSFVAITAHYLDEDTSMCSSLLGCIEFNERHTATNLAEMLKTECAKWEIQHKITAVVTDNAPNIVGAVRNCNWRHIPCYAHTLNLIVKASSIPIQSIIEKCKTIVQYFKKSSHALSKLHDIQRQMQFPILKLIQDVPTRWNSTYEMLRRVSANKAPIQSTLALLDYNEVNIVSEEWNVIEHAISLLQVFDEVSKEVSAEKTVTLSKAVILSKNLLDYVSEFSKSQNLPIAIVDMCKTAKDQINERLISKEPDLGKQCAVLDPRFKKSAFSSNPSKFESVYANLLGLIQLQIAREQPQTSTPLNSENASSSTAPSKLWEKFDKEVATLTGKSDPKAASIVELDKFLSEGLLPRIEDPLVWWQQRKLIYPHLYAIVLKRLCIPASSVPCERIFSKAGQTMTERRSRLETKKLSKLLFINVNSC